MKKILMLTMAATLLATVAPAKDLSDRISLAVERAVAEQPSVFANERVKQLCKEWPTCQEWVKNKTQHTQRFQVVDAEAERYLKGWKGKEAIWQYKFYVQTQENGATKVYVFKRGDSGMSYAAPVEIKKFPGHPGEPIDKIFTHGRYGRTCTQDLLYTWPGGKKLEQEFGRKYGLLCGIISQYIYKYDDQGNALWKKRLYIRSDRKLSVYFEAYQTEVNGDYTYKDPVLMGKFPHCYDEF